MIIKMPIPKAISMGERVEFLIKNVYSDRVCMTAPNINIPIIIAYDIPSNILIIGKDVSGNDT